MKSFFTADQPNKQKDPQFDPERRQYPFFEERKNKIMWSCLLWRPFVNKGATEISFLGESSKQLNSSMMKAQVALKFSHVLEV